MEARNLGGDPEAAERDRTAEEKLSPSRDLVGLQKRTAINPPVIRKRKRNEVGENRGTMQKDSGLESGCRPVTSQMGSEKNQANDVS
jgi:hypothetical protein